MRGLGHAPDSTHTHLPSNVLLIGVAFAPNLASAIALLLARFALAQMDVPAAPPRSCPCGPSARVSQAVRVV